MPWLSREISSEDGERLDLNESLVFAIFGMEMRRTVVAKVHSNHNPKNRVTQALLPSILPCRTRAAEAESFRGDPLRSGHLEPVRLPDRPRRSA